MTQYYEISYIFLNIYSSPQRSDNFNNFCCLKYLNIIIYKIIKSMKYY